MTEQINPLNLVMTTNDIAVEYDKQPATIRQFLIRNFEDMSKRGVIRKTGGTWLVLRVEVERIWGK